MADLTFWLQLKVAVFLPLAAFGGSFLAFRLWLALLDRSQRLMDDRSGFRQRERWRQKSWRMLLFSLFLVVRFILLPLRELNRLLCSSRVCRRVC